MKVTIPGLLEGEVAKKQDILDTKTAWDGVDENVDEQNIREEGLDRRVFQQGRTWVSEGVRAAATQRTQIQTYDYWWPMPLVGNLHGSDPPTLVTSPVIGGLDSSIPTIGFSWDPNEHSYAIIRLSLWVWADVPTNNLGSDFAPSFGIWAQTPEQANDGITPAFDEASLLVPGNAIKTWKTVKLCEDYRISTATPLHDAGLVNEYDHSRKSKLSASVSMVYVVNSGNGYSGHGLPTRGWDEAGEPRFKVVYNSYATTTSPGTEYIVVGNLNFSAQVFRR